MTETPPRITQPGSVHPIRLMPCGIVSPRAEWALRNERISIDCILLRHLAQGSRRAPRYFGVHEAEDTWREPCIYSQHLLGNEELIGVSSHSMTGEWEVFVVDELTWY